MILILLLHETELNKFFQSASGSLMAQSLTRYFQYKCHLLIHGYIRIHLNKILNNDLSNLFLDYIQYPDSVIADMPQRGRFEINLLTPIQYLLLTEIFKSAAKPPTSILTLLSYNELWLNLHENNYIENISFIAIHWLKDKTLFHSLSMCINWTLEQKQCPFWAPAHYDNNIEFLYLQTVIKFCKKGIEIKYPLMLNLITMYEKYYFDQNIWQQLKAGLYDKNNKKSKDELYEKILKIMVQRKSNFWMECVTDFVEWNELDAMKLSTMIQVVSMEYDENGMEELMNIVDIISVRCSALCQRLMSLIPPEREPIIVYPRRDDASYLLIELL